MATFVSLAAEVQPSSSYVAPTRTYTRSDIATFSSDMGQRSFEPMDIDVAAHSYVSPPIIADVAPSSITVAARHQLPAIVSRPSTASKRQPKSSVPIGINEPSIGSVRKESQSGVTGSKSIGIESQPIRLLTLRSLGPRRLLPDIRCPKVLRAHRRCMVGLRRRPRLCLLV